MCNIDIKFVFCVKLCLQNIIFTKNTYVRAVIILLYTYAFVKADLICLILLLKFLNLIANFVKTKYC